MTIIVGLASGVIGTVISTLLRISHERAADLRTRMLDAADDFVTAAVAAREAVDGVDTLLSVAEFIDQQPETKDARARFQAAHEAIDAAEIRCPRLRLLFGAMSDAAKQANLVTDGMAQWMLYQHDKWYRLTSKKPQEREDPPPDVANFDDLIDAFSQAARAQLVGRVSV